ncbi:zf-HC2 domain-containing protein [Candidatus Magnetomonas plexicatena]|uniref:zf-HC2 domain-containing protein n=1 Tax=Candidatus Magnetomonas plexicatena TaxID=2552947 RepID=UPI001C77EA1A|nr:zf-HC2 domain-containing protein [Nitrospirales bacterium LBB_01]
MKIKHDDIQDMLHNYLKGTLSKETTLIIREHISVCSDCAKELIVIESLLRNEVPDPGGMFFNNLARTVITQAKEPQTFNFWNFLRLNPIAVAAVCLVIVLVAYNYAGFLSVRHIPLNSENEIAKNKVLQHKVIEGSVSDDISCSEYEYKDIVSTDYDGEEYSDLTL